VHVDVKERRGFEMMHNEARLFGRFTNAGLFGRLTRVHVSPGLHPDAETSMSMKYHAA
jgi:hypothetical protein